jgi:DNA-directed RNA polymerase specialized sigma subunit
MTEDNNLLQRYIRDLNLRSKDFDANAVEVMFSKLIELEKKFGEKLHKSRQGKRVYVEFVSMIHETNMGMVSLRPYFRLKESAYLSVINSKAIGRGHSEVLYNAPINFKFINFAMGKMELPNKKFVVLFEKMKLIRQEIINNNLFLALGKAKSHGRSSGFFSETSDLVQMANEGLIMAVDKYVPGEGSVFANVAIGRMIAEMIDKGSNSSSATINSGGKKRLYRIRKLLSGNPNLTRSQVAEILNVAEEEVNALLEATYHSSLDQPVGVEDDRTLGDVTPDTSTTDAYEITENKDLFLKLLSSYQYLSVIEQKILKLKGVNLMKTLNKLVAVTVPLFKHDTEPTQTAGFVVSDKLSPTLVESKVVMDSDKYKADDVVYFKSDIRNNPILNSRYKFEDKEFILVPEELVVAMK